jgi:hypothetical protein
VRTQLRVYKEGLFEQDNYQIQVSEKRAHILTSIKIDSISEKNTRISLDSILSFTVEGNGFIFSSGIDNDDVEYIRGLNKNEIEELFSKQIKKEFGNK